MPEAETLTDDLQLIGQLLGSRRSQNITSADTVLEQAINAIQLDMLAVRDRNTTSRELKYQLDTMLSSNASIGTYSRREPEVYTAKSVFSPFKPVRIGEELYHPITKHKQGKVPKYPETELTFTKTQIDDMIGNRSKTNVTIRDQMALQRLQDMNKSDDDRLFEQLWSKRSKEYDERIRTENITQRQNIERLGEPLHAEVVTAPALTPLLERIQLARADLVPPPTPLKERILAARADLAPARRKLDTNEVFPFIESNIATPFDLGNFRYLNQVEDLLRDTFQATDKEIQSVYNRTSMGGFAKAISDISYSHSPAPTKKKKGVPREPTHRRTFA